MTRSLLFLLLLTASPSVATASGMSRAKALEVLSTTDTFADVYVSIVGAPSQQACAFRTVLDQPDADRLFKRLLTRARLAGRLYALCGLYFTDHERFTDAIQPYRASKDSVATFMGCLGGRQSIARLVESSNPRVIRFENRSETTQEWVERHVGPDGSRDFDLDILGGGWPARFKELKGCDR